MYHLRPYQQEDVHKLIQKNAMGVFNEQRTGKTPTSLKAMEAYGIDKILIVAPASMLPVWKDEYETWLNKPCVIATGSAANIDRAFSNWTSGLVTNYEQLRNDKRRFGLIERIVKLKPEGVIIDEAHRIKDYNSANAKAVFKLSKADYKLALTGTPAPNKPEEVWSILHFLYPKIFSSYWRFIEEYFKWYQSPFSQYGRDVGEFISKEKELEFQKMLSYISIMRKRKDVMPWLPKEEKPIRVRLELTKIQKKCLKELKDYFETEHLVTQGVLDRVMRYRQICLAPELVGIKGDSPKLKWIKSYIKDYPDKPTVIFSKFTAFIKLIEKENPEVVRVIDGSTKLRTRQDLIKQFQNGKIQILAIQIDAGKEGLTLDRAECLIFTDQYPPASDVAQAKDRIVATSPERADTPKQIIELVMSKSFDEKLFDLVAKNTKATDIINNYIYYINKEEL